jgi:hypothetical protein
MTATILLAFLSSSSGHYCTSGQCPASILGAPLTLILLRRPWSVNLRVMDKSNAAAFFVISHITTMVPCLPPIKLEQSTCLLMYCTSEKNRRIETLLQIPFCHESERTHWLARCPAVHPPLFFPMFHPQMRGCHATRCMRRMANDKGGPCLGSPAALSPSAAPKAFSSLRQAGKEKEEGGKGTGFCSERPQWAARPALHCSCISAVDEEESMTILRTFVTWLGELSCFVR